MSVVQSTSRAAVARVHDRLGELVGEWFGAGSRLAAPAPQPIRRAWSFQFPVTIVTKAGPRRLIVKIPSWEEAPTLEAALAAGPQSSTRTEFETLARLAEAVAASGDPGLAAVRPIAYVDDLNAIVTAELESRSLRDHLRWGAGRRASAILARTGRLLRLYHERVGGLSRGPFPSEEVRRRLRELGAESAQLGRVPLGLRAGIDAVWRRAPRVASSDVCLAVTHNDLNPANVLVTPGGSVALLDPSPGPGVAVDDLAKLTVALRTPSVRLMSGGAVPSRASVTSWTRALLAGYRPPDAEAAALFRATAVARRWLDLEGRVARLGPVRIAARRLLARELEDALAGRW